MWAFGFRQDGVDCLTFIESRLDSEGVNAYDSIYLLWVYPDNDPEFPSMTMELCKAY